jgi:hypothetical protein
VIPGFFDISQSRLNFCVNGADGLEVNLDFDGCLGGIEPVGAEAKAEEGIDKGTFYWAIPLSRSKVTGEFSIGTSKYTIGKRLGYHDHDYWKVNREHRLFIDDVISRWYWGRCCRGSHHYLYGHILSG